MFLLMHHVQVASEAREAGTCQEVIPKGNNRHPTIHFQVRTVSFREGFFICMIGNFLASINLLEIRMYGKN